MKPMMHQRADFPVRISSSPGSTKVLTRFSQRLTVCCELSVEA